jgi:hypothetical protein
MCAAVVDPRKELRALGGGGRLSHQLEPFRTGVRGLRVLLAFGGTARSGLTKIDQAPSPWRITLR